MVTGRRRRGGIRDHPLGATLAAAVFVGVATVAAVGASGDGGGHALVATAGDTTATTTGMPALEASGPPANAAPDTTTLSPDTAPVTSAPTTTAPPRRHTIAVWVDHPEAARANGYATFVVDVTYASEHNGAVEIDFGDGTDPLRTNDDRISPGQGPWNFCSGAPERWVFRHFYRQPGTYRITVVQQTCGFTAPPERVTASTTLVVAPKADADEPDVTNGPEPVQLDAFSLTPDGSGLRVVGSVGWYDRDGYVREVTIDWGDGSSPEVTTFPLSDCDDGGGRHFPTSSGGLPLEHRYAAAGRYVAKVTVISTGCDGTTPQTVADDNPISVGNAPPD
jgi:hypothetical protein